MGQVKTGKTNINTPLQYGKFRLGGRFKSAGASNDKGIPGFYKGMKVRGRKAGGKKR